MDNGANSYRRFREEGDAEGFVELIRDYRDGLILYLDTFVHDYRTAEELAEDTFVMLGVKKPKDKGKGSFKTWLYTMGRNIALMYLRKKRRRGETPLEDCDAITQSGESLEESYIREEDKVTVHRAMRSLSPDQRQILWLVYFEDLSVAEAASVMKRSLHAAEALACRARKALKEQLLTEGFVYENI